MKFISTLVAAFFLLSGNLGAQEIGRWRDHFNFSQTLFVEIMGDKVFAAQRNGLFILDRDGGIERLNKVNGLSDIGISTIKASDQETYLLVGYENGNLDIIKGRTVYNMPDIKNSSQPGDKRIRHITFHNEIAYLSTGIGIIAVDAEMREVRDTFTILPEGGLAVNATTIYDGDLYAATNEGLFHAPPNQDLTIYTFWEQDLTLPDPFARVDNVDANDAGLYVNRKSAAEPGVYFRAAGVDAWTNIRATPYVDELRNSPLGMSLNTSWYYLIYGEDGVSISKVVDQYPEGFTAMQIKTGTVDSEGNIWFADGRNALVKRNADGTTERFQPTGPGSNSIFDLSMHGGRLWVAGGHPVHPGTWNNNFRLSGFYKYHEGRWTNFTIDNHPEISDWLFLDVPVAYPDRNNPDKAYVGSWFSGMMVVEGDEIEGLYNETNSSLHPRVGYGREDGMDFIAVGGIVQDGTGNVWMTNGYADKPLSVWTADGEWKAFSLKNELGTNTTVHKMIITDEGHKWFIRNRGGLVAYYEGDDLLNESDDKVRILSADLGRGNLPSNEVFCLAQDLDGEIWVGTADGVGVFYSPFDIFSDNPGDARQILVEQDGIYQYLLETQPVSAIAVDGANRKWVGTFGSGVFLLSEDGTEEILRFNVANSALPSDMIMDIEIDHQTGEVFFATEEGLVSYISDATGAGVANECHTVYPNPVRETYDGPISVKGLMRNSEVRITDARGNLIFSDVSKGGNAVWDGRNIDGERVATGVYFALITEPESRSTCTTKILVIK